MRIEDVLKSHGVGVGSSGVEIEYPDNTDLSMNNRMIYSIDKRGNIYLRQQGTTYLEGRKYDKNFNLIQTFVAEQSIFGISEYGYSVYSTTASRKIYDLNGNLLGTITPPYASNMCILREDTALYYTTLNAVAKIITLQGTVLFELPNLSTNYSYTAVLNTKGNFVVAQKYSDQYQVIYRIDKNLNKNTLNLYNNNILSTNFQNL